MQKRIIPLVVALLGLGFTVGCAANPADDVPAADVSDPITDAVVEEEAPAEGDELEAGNAVDEVDPNAPMDDPAAAGADLNGEYPLYGSIAVNASKVTRSHHIVFHDWTGSLKTDGTPEGSTLGFEVQIASLEADPDSRDDMTEKLESHLITEDFFLADTYPTATFVSTSIVEGGTDGATHTITGDLTMRGVTKQVSFPANVTVADGMASAKAEFVINRQDWGIAYTGKPDDLVRDEVVMQIDLTTDASMAPNASTEG